MSDIVARLRADIDIREKPSAKSLVSDRFPTHCLVSIIEDLGEWVKIKPVRLKKTITGYVPRFSLLFPPVPTPPVFPDIIIGDKSFPSVPKSVKLSDFLVWLPLGGKPAWIGDVIWTQLTPAKQAEIVSGITASTTTAADKWAAWQADVTTAKRQAEAVMDEWVVTVQGGREIYTIRDHYIYKGPVQNDEYFGSPLKGQIMLWTGEIRSSTTAGVTRTFYKVKFYRMSREMIGWFRADLAQDYFYPTDLNDPDIETNSANVFDLTKPVLRFPQDPEIAEAIASKLTGYQYINIRNAIGKSLRHFCLCGEFCVATLSGKDIVPLLKNWFSPPPGEKKYSRAASILTNSHEGTTVVDLQSFMKVAGLPPGEVYPSTVGTPSQVIERLQKGQMPVAGCGINSGGKILAAGTIRHWVIVEDVLPVGTGGWVRVYNPFKNREEVYEYNLFMTSAGTGMGLWVTLPVV